MLWAIRGPTGRMGFPTMFFPPCDNLTLGGGPWWSSALTSDLGLRCAVIAGVGAVLLAATIRGLWNLSRGPSPARPWRDALQNFRGVRGESGTATVEFVLVFVPALAVCLVLLQTVLAFSGNLFVHYAAYTATRVAIVEAPTGALGGGGTIRDSAEDETYRKAERAAAFALAPVSGKLSGGSGEPAGFVAGLNDYFDAYDQEAPNWVANVAGQRLAYALRHTSIDLYQTRLTAQGVRLVKLTDAGAETLSLGPKDPVTVGVNHRLHLSIPYAAAVFADGQQETAGGRTSYTNVTATCTMTLEGYDRNLPPQPELEREP